MTSTGHARLGDEAVLARGVLSQFAASASAIPGSDYPLSENRYYGKGGAVLPAVARLADSNYLPPGSGAERRWTYGPYRATFESAPAGVGEAGLLLDVGIPNTTIGMADSLVSKRFEGPIPRALSPSSALPHLRHETARLRHKRRACEERIEFLQEEARHEGYALNPASHRDFEHFALGSDNVRMGGLVLLENGNLRAIWRDEQGTRLGLQFLGGGRVQYVIFRRRTEERSVSRVAGRDSLKGLERQLAAFDMRALVYE